MNLKNQTPNNDVEVGGACTSAERTASSCCHGDTEDLVLMLSFILHIFTTEQVARQHNFQQKPSQNEQRQEALSLKKT